MTKDELRARHIELDRSFHELLACFLAQTRPQKVFKVPLGDLLKWSQEQAVSPQCERTHNPSSRTPAGRQKPDENRRGES